jgi:hypothetical protein
MVREKEKEEMESKQGREERDKDKLDLILRSCFPTCPGREDRGRAPGFT